MQNKNFLGAIVACIAFWPQLAVARCTINAAGLAIAPLTASTGTYTPPVAPLSQAVTFTISGTYSTNNTAGTCRIGVAFARTSLPATMARSGGGATLPYSITTASGGGGTDLIFTGGGTPNAANLLISAFAAAGRRLTNRPFTTTVTAHFLQQPAFSQRAGSYSDGPTVRLYNVRNIQVTQLASRPFIVTGVVDPACTIGASTTPSADSATIPVGAGGTVNTAPISRTYASVVCNSLSVLQVSSQSGGVRRTGGAPSGFTNIIDYAALAAFSGASSSINTATNPAASGPETGSSGTTSSSTPSGTLSVTITPQSPAQPLVSGTYSDTLRVTITAQ